MVHDPLTVIWRWSFRGWWLTVWHKDPERGGNDDSCDWFCNKRPLEPDERAIIEACWDMESLLDNAPHYPSSSEHKAWRRLDEAIRLWRRRKRRWRVHPRWHVWHWRVNLVCYRKQERAYKDTAN